MDTCFLANDVFTFETPYGLLPVYCQEHVRSKPGEEFLANQVVLFPAHVIKPQSPNFSSLGRLRPPQKQD